jgi:hypothetical protein
MGAPKRALPQALAANRWEPGQSGNPSGHSGEYGHAVRLARQAAPYAVQRLIQLMDSDDERVAAVACNLFATRASMLGLDLAAPDHSTISRRGETLPVSRPRPGSEAVHLLVDSTGLKLCGPGEWLVEALPPS